MVADDDDVRLGYGGNVAVLWDQGTENLDQVCRSNIACRDHPCHNLFGQRPSVVVNGRPRLFYCGTLHNADYVAGARRTETVHPKHREK